MNAAASRVAALAGAGTVLHASLAKRRGCSARGGPARAEGRGRGAGGGAGPYPEHAGAELRLVQVLHRHGARTPFLALSGMPEPDTPEWYDLWGQCRLSPKALAASTASNAARRSSGGVPLSGEAAGPTAAAGEGSARGVFGPCGKGQLTRYGEEQLERLGAFLRGEYLEGPRGRLLAAGPLPPADQLVVTSTKTSRTIVSAQALLHGLFPEAGAADVEALVKVPRLFHEDILVANFARCDRLRLLFHEVKEQVDSSLPSVHTRRRLVEEVGPMAERISLIGAGDPLRSLHGAGLPVPGNVSDGLRRELDACGHEMVDAAHGRHSTEMRRLGMGLLLEEMHGQITAAVEGRTPLRCVLRSAHDISVCGLLAALGLQVHDWPQFASSVIVELLRDLGSGEFRVRVVAYDGVPGEKEGNKVVDLTVPLQAWSEAVRPLLLTEQEYLQECSLPPGMAKPPPQAW